MEYDLPEEVRVELDGPVRIITLNRPEKFNTVNPGLHRGLRLAFEQMQDDREVRAAILTGAGKAFSAGGDISTFGDTATDIDWRRYQLRGTRHLADRMLDCHVPVVAAINGAAVGLGCSIAVLCDIVFASEKAYFADPHVAVGLVAGDGGAASWPLMMSILKAKELLLLGTRVSAQEALGLGLVNRVVPHDDLMTEALALAHRLAKLPPASVQDTKRSLNLHMKRAFHGVMDFAIAAESESFVTPEHHAKVEEFMTRKGEK
ncbi:MAG: enoyl-CoA hydratase/isomerase family protein [Acidimicrobiia bacterium]|nr:enoyl-CoA hydratase/isomerase family protein [Acidimicrobiia bacterium]